MPVVRLITRKPCTMDSRLLSSTDADCLTILGIRNRVRLRVFQRDQRDREIQPLLRGKLLLLRDNIRKRLIRHLVIIPLLLEGHTENLLVFKLGRTVGRIDFDDIVIPLLLALQKLQSRIRVPWCNDSIRHFAVDDLCGRLVAHIRQRDEIAIGAHTVDAAGTGISTGERGIIEAFDVIDKASLLKLLGKLPADRRAGRRNMLEGSCRHLAGRLLDILDELPAVERIQEIDVAGTSVQNLNRELGTILHINLRRFLVRVHTIL